MAAAISRRAAAPLNRHGSSSAQPTSLAVLGPHRSAMQTLRAAWPGRIRSVSRYGATVRAAHTRLRFCAQTASRPDRSEEHTSELQSLMRNSYAVFCLKKKTKTNKHTHYIRHIIRITNV